MERRAHPRARGVTADHGGHGRRGVGIRAIRRVVSGRKGLHRHDGRVHVLRQPWHERNLIAELTVGRVIERVTDGLARVRRVRHVGVVHAGDHHVRRIAGRVGWVHLPGRIVQAVEDAPLVRIQPRDFVAGKVPHRDRHVRHRELLAKLRRIRVELGREVIEHEACEVRGNVGRAEQVELRQHGHLVVEPDLLAVAQVPRRARERRHLLRRREDTHVVRHDAQVTHARPVSLGHAGVAFTARERDGAEVAGRVLRVVAVVVRVHRSLVGHDVDVAQAGKLLHHRGDEVVADQDVLVFLLHQFVSGRHHHFHHVLAGRQHHRAVTGRIGNADLRIAIRAGRLAADRVTGSDARELIHPVVRRRLQLIEDMHAVIALELRVVRQCPLLRIEPLRRVLQREEVRIGRLLPRAVHVRNTVGAKALRPVVPAGRLGGIHEFERLGSIRSGALLVQIDGRVRDIRNPLRMHRHGRIVKRARGCIHHFATNAAVFVGRERLLAELDEPGLAREALPAHGGHPRRINPAGGRVGARVVVAVRIVAVDRARHPQVVRQMRGGRLLGVRQIRGDDR